MWSKQASQLGGGIESLLSELSPELPVTPNVLNLGTEYRLGRTSYTQISPPPVSLVSWFVSCAAILASYWLTDINENLSG